MAEEDQFVEGRTYFNLGFYDRALSIPMVITYIFVGKNEWPELSKDGKNLWYFKRPNIEEDPNNPPDNSKSPVLEVGEESISDFLDLNGLIRVLEQFRREGEAPR